MKIKLTLLIAFLPILSFSQELKRTTFDYDKLNSENFPNCNDSINQVLNISLIAIDENKSEFAIKNASELYALRKDCYEIYDVYAYALFRNGKWFEGIDIIEEGINKFGSVPELIKRRSDMSIEMAQLGTKRKNIDGNSVYKASTLAYDEQQFKLENFKSALLDLNYLVATYNRSVEIFYVGKIYQVLKEYSKSSETFQKLLTDEDYKYEAIFNIADNHISLNNFEDAETELNKVLIANPKEGVVFEKLAEIYELKNDPVKAKEFKQKAVYYNNIPPFSNLDYSQSNFDLLVLFGTDETEAKVKIEKLNTIVKENNNDFTIDVCLMILKLHANHGNGVEERATEILATIGRPAISKVNELFQLEVSTCTITNLAEVMAKVKDKSSWELMKSYLPLIATMPMTLIPPNLPEKMVQFNEHDGVKEILIVVKPLLNKVKAENNDPMADLAGFGQYVYYMPLKKINKKKLKKIANEIHYTDEEFNLLEEKLK